MGIAANEDLLAKSEKHLIEPALSPTIFLSDSPT
jgi:hypothetical protein